MNRYQKLLARRSVPGRTPVFNEKYNELLEDDDVKYLLGSMEPLDADYTQKSLFEAERVHKYLDPLAEIRIQGSITTNTHIRYYSDIDILTITREFYSYDGPNPGGAAYGGDLVGVLKKLRSDSKITVAAKFPAVTIIEKDRALALSGGTLQRNIDVVAANWLNTAEYQQSTLEKDRAIQVLDSRSGTRITNKPFLHQHLINQKGTITSDGVKKAIRLLKTLKADSDSSIDISSYDIASLVWNMPDDSLPGGAPDSFRLASNVANTLLHWNEEALKSLWVPNRTRKIIDPEGTSVAAVTSLWHELHKLLEKIKKTGKKLDKQATVYGRILLQSS